MSERQQEHGIVAATCDGHADTGMPIRVGDVWFHRVHGEREVRGRLGEWGEWSMGGLITLPDNPRDTWRRDWSFVRRGRWMRPATEYGTKVKNSWHPGPPPFETSVIGYWVADDGYAVGRMVDPRNSLKEPGDTAPWWYDGTEGEASGPPDWWMPLPEPPEDSHDQARKT